MGFAAGHCERCRCRITVSILRAKASSLGACQNFPLVAVACFEFKQGREGLLILWSSEGNVARLRFRSFLVERNRAR